MKNINRDLLIRNIISAILFVALILITVLHLKKMKEMKTIYGIDLTFAQSLKAGILHNSFIPQLLIISAFLGSFSKKKIGWLLIVIPFYFAFFDLLIVDIPNNYQEIIGYFLLLIPLATVLAINWKQIRKSYDAMKRQLTLNLIAILFALLFTCLKGYLFLHPDLPM